MLLTTIKVYFLFNGIAIFNEAYVKYKFSFTKTRIITK